MKERIEAEKGVKLDYASIVHPLTLEELERLKGKAVALVAARVGKTRLIDNAVIRPGRKR